MSVGGPGEQAAERGEIDDAAAAWRFMMGAADWAQRNWDLRLTLRMWSHWSSVSSSNFAGKNVPELLTRMSRRPNSFSAVENNFWTSERWETSAWTAIARRPDRFDFGYELFGFGFGAGVVDDDVGAVGGQAESDAAADAFGGAGDQGDLAF